jgi:hypothetical protein
MSGTKPNTIFIQNLILCALIAFSFAASPTFRAKAQEEICSEPDEPVSIPLIDLGSQPYTRMDGQSTSYTGGLYPDSSNQPPADHLEAALQFASQVTPLDQDGKPDPVNGQIVMISVGMSNTTHEFIHFIDLAHKNRQAVNPKLNIINGALGGQTAERWVDPNARTWELVDAELKHRKVTPQQVQIVWVKQTHTLGGDFPQKAQALQVDLEAIARNLKVRYPNIKLAYYSSRTRSYMYWRGLSPEPNAFETGFSVKWMIEKQINGDPALNYDPQRGEAVAPILLWGPYLWADGGNPRSDGLVWLAEDMERDCTHPSQQGSSKVAEMLFHFFSTDETARSWFLSSEAQAILPASTTPVNTPVPPSSTPTQSPTPLPSETSTTTPDRQPTRTRAHTPTAEPTRVQAQAIQNQPEVSPTAAEIAEPDSENPLGWMLPAALITALIFVSGWLWARQN